jgi:predicted ATPase
VAAVSGRVIISGGPGSGKSTLIAALAAAGETCCEEVARPLIREEQAVGGDRLPWADVRGFVEICRHRMRAQLASARGAAVCFFDRGLPDLTGYLAHRGFTSAPVVEDIRAYSPIVFMAPPWPDIFVNDAERPQSRTVAADIYTHLRHVYMAGGFTICELPRDTVTARVAVVRHTLATADRSALTWGD